MKKPGLCVFVLVCAIVEPSSARAQRAVWELPAGTKEPDFQKRTGWKKPSRNSRFPGGAVVENGSVAVVVRPGAAGAVLRANGGGPAASVELRLLDAEGRSAPVRSVAWIASEEQEAILHVKTARAEARLVIQPGATHVEVRPGTGARQLLVRMRARFAVVPKFVENDVLYDPRDAASMRVPEAAGNMLLHLLDGGDAISALLWKAGERDDASGDGAEPVAPVPREEPVKAILTARGKGAARYCAETRVDFLDKPVWAALLYGRHIWHCVDLRGRAGGATEPIKWKRPFDARWLADYRVTGFRKKQVKAFLKTAAELGLSTGHERAWRQEYDVLEGDKDAAEFFGTESHYFRTAAKDKPLPRCKLSEDTPETIVCPAIFRDDQSLLTPPARWPAWPDPTRGWLAVVQKRRAARGEAPLHPIHWYGYAVFYPADRSRQTPLGRRTVLDLMREALGTAPCDLSWLEDANACK